MKSFVKSILLAALCILTTQADVAIYNPTSTAAVSVLQNPVTIFQVQYANAATNSVTVTLVDAPTNSTTWINTAYTNNVYTLSNVVTPSTNITGGIYYTTNKTLIATPTAIAAVTNSYRTLNIMVIPASSSVSWTPPFGQPTGFGLLASTTATNVTATITYLPSR